jgi:methylmalonyl-CoA/ethylmalonyl-CoA epimerase
MNVKKISHLGIAVESIEDQISPFKDILGLEFTGEEIVEDQKVRVAFLKVGESRVELIEPISDDSPIRKFLDKKGGRTTIHHIAYEVDDLESAIKEAKEKGAEMIDEEPRIGAGGVRIAFIHPKSASGILTELCEQH